MVRPMEPRDSGEVTLLIKQLGYDRTEQEIVRWIAELNSSADKQAAFVACIGDEVVGWIEVSIERHLQSLPFALIGGLVVKDGVRRRGIGRHLCQEVEAWTWDRNLDTLRVTSRSARKDAHRFYLRDGYREIKTSLVFEKTRPK